MERLRRLPSWAIALAFATLLCLTRLGAFGLWDPWELKIAERARQMADAGTLLDPTAGKGLSDAPVVAPFLQALGVKLLGPTELGVRLFGALAAIGALMATYWAGTGLFRRRAALLAVLTLGSTATFALSARQLVSNMPLIAALALALGGLGRFAWPWDGRRRWSHAAVGLGALLLGYGAGGALIGVALPVLALAATLLVCARLPVRDAQTMAAPETGITDGTDVLAAPGAGPHVVAGRSFGTSTLHPRAYASWFFVLLALAGLALVVAALSGFVAGRYSPLLGGVPRGGPPAHTFEQLIRELGFGLFPWSAVAFFALGRPLIRLDEDEALRTHSRLVFGQTYLLVFAAFGYAMSTALVWTLGEARYVALAAIGLALGVFLDEALEGSRSEPVAGLLMAVGTVIVGRDFLLSPEDLASVHLLGERAKWPPAVFAGPIVLAIGVLVALGVYTGLATRGKALGKLPPREGAAGPAWFRKLEAGIVKAGRYGLQGAVALSVLFAFWLTQIVVPQLSRHFSFKPVMESYARYATGNEKIGRYRVEARATSFYGARTMTELGTLDQVVAFLRDPARVFALVASEELAALDAAMKQANLPYFAVDASSSRFLLVSNQLKAGEADHNPLKKNVWTGKEGEAPPWSWRVPLSATFADAIELVGANYPESIRRPGKITLELFFKVRARPPAGYKIFVHVDGPATPRLIGDHDPVAKTFPTAHWLPGEYIRDVVDIDAPLMTTPAGSYQIFVGFWPGGDGRRLKVTQGPNDGADRVRVGPLEIR